MFRRHPAFNRMRMPEASNFRPSDLARGRAGWVCEQRAWKHGPTACGLTMAVPFAYRDQYRAHAIHDSKRLDKKKKGRTVPGAFHWPCMRCRRGPSRGDTTWPLPGATRALAALELQPEPPHLRLKRWPIQLGLIQLHVQSMQRLALHHMLLDLRCMLLT